MLETRDWLKKVLTKEREGIATMEKGWESIKPLKTTEKAPFPRWLQVIAGIRREVEEAGTVKIDF